MTISWGRRSSVSESSVASLKKKLNTNITTFVAVDKSASKSISQVVESQAANICILWKGTFRQYSYNEAKQSTRCDSSV